jgi:hypothetical protein
MENPDILAIGRDLHARRILRRPLAVHLASLAGCICVRPPHTASADILTETKMGFLDFLKHGLVRLPEPKKVPPQPATPSGEEILSMSNRCVNQIVEK